MNQVQTISSRLTPAQAISQSILRLVRWRIIGRFPDQKKYIVIGAPHTTNWDFVLTLLFKSASGVNLQWIGKDSLFRWPFGGLMKWLGGIPVNRKIRNNFVDQMVEKFQQREQLTLAISPEGTRRKSHYWKTGFYYMAAGAQVPIQLVAINYADRSIEIGPLLAPDQGIEKTFGLIRKFYHDKKGKYPELQGEIQFQPGSDI
jgi:1-acyl-sn-glycerol-3-phosphate acyltransferase